MGNPAADLTKQLHPLSAGQVSLGRKLRDRPRLFHVFHHEIRRVVTEDPGHTGGIDPGNARMRKATEDLGLIGKPAGSRSRHDPLTDHLHRHGSLGGILEPLIHPPHPAGTEKLHDLHISHERSRSQVVGLGCRDAAHEGRQADERQGLRRWFVEVGRVLGERPGIRSALAHP